MYYFKNATRTTRSWLKSSKSTPTERVATFDQLPVLPVNQLINRDKSNHLDNMLKLEKRYCLEEK